MDIQQQSLIDHEKTKGKVSIVSLMPITNKDELSSAYTPGVAEPCRRIAKNLEDAYKYTFKGRMVAVISDGSAVLGLGNIGPEAALPVMEGKSVLFKEFAGVDSFPLCIDTQDADEIIDFCIKVAPTFGGINLEDISAPRCFYIEDELKKKLDIPVFHDDQHGTAIVVLAGLLNGLKIVNKKMEDLKIVLNGAGSAGIAIAKILSESGVKNLVLLDSKGVIHSERKDLNEYKELFSIETSDRTLEDALKGADVFIGISRPNLVSEEMVKSMNSDSIIFAMANPDPEIMPNIAKEAGARIVATGRSDFPNQINNVLAFPGIFKGALEGRAKAITEEMKLAAAHAIADCVESPSEDMIIPSPFNKDVPIKVAEAIKKCLD